MGTSDAPPRNDEPEIEVKRNVWIWVLGIAIVAGVVAFVWSRRPVEMIEVSLVSAWSWSHEPVTNGFVKITHYRVPVVSSVLPQSWFSSTQVFVCPSGSFRLPRIRKGDFLKRVEVAVSQDGTNWQPGPVFTERFPKEDRYVHVWETMR